MEQGSKPRFGDLRGEIPGGAAAKGACLSNWGSFQAEEEDYSEEESAKVELKHDSNDSCESAAKAEKGDEKPDSRGAVTGERQSGDGQVGVQHAFSGPRVDVLAEGLLQW